MTFQIDVKRLRGILIAKQLPVTDAARAAGMTRQGLGFILDGRSSGRHREGTVYKLAKALDVDPLTFAHPIEV